MEADFENLSFHPRLGIMIRSRPTRSRSIKVYFLSPKEPKKSNF